MYLYDEQPIIALSTGTSISALAVIRISGFEDPSVFKNFFHINFVNLKPNKVLFTKLYDGEKVLDEVVLTYFKAPHSYNGENILEISAHGNPLNVKRIIDAFIASKIVRMAGKGEFTYRALKNHKLNLSQVEGLDQLLNATSGLMLDQGLATLHGALHQEFLNLHKKFLNLKIALEMNIDFADDMGEEESRSLLKLKAQEFSDAVESLYQRSTGDLNQLTNPSIVLLGATNAGKSSLFNYLLKSNRSIVSDVHGTTRDYVSEYLNFAGNNFRLVDTAGLRNSDDKIESIGIERSYDQIKNAFLRILVVDPTIDNFVKIEEADEQPDLVIFTHSDVDTFNEKIKPYIELYKSTPKYSVQLNKSGPIEPVFLGGSIEPENQSGSIGPLFDVVKNISVNKFNELCADGPILVARHRETITKIHEQLADFMDLYHNESDIGIISHELTRLESSISELIGIITPNEVLTSIFSNFCIGK